MKYLRQYIKQVLAESDDYTNKLLDLMAAGEHAQAYDLAEMLDIDLEAKLLSLIQPIYDGIEKLVHTPSTCQDRRERDQIDRSGYNNIEPFLNQLNEILGTNFSIGSSGRENRYKGKGSQSRGVRIYIGADNGDELDMFMDFARKTGQDWDDQIVQFSDETAFFIQVNCPA